MGDRGHNKHGLKGGGGAVPLSREPGPRLVQCDLSRGLLSYQAASSSIQPFGHNRHGPKLGGSGCAHFLEVAGPTSNTMLRSVGRGLPPYQVASSSIQPFGHNKHGPKIWGLRPHCRGGGTDGSPSNTKSPGLRPTSIPRVAC